MLASSTPPLRTAVAAITLVAVATPAPAQNATDRIEAALAAEAVPVAPAPPAAGGPTVSQGGVVRAPSGETVEASAILVEGAPSIPPAEFLAATEPYLARALDDADLRALATAVANVLRGRGYVFATARVASQELRHGVLRVSADEGRIDRVRFTGRERPAVARALRDLTDGQPVTATRLQRALLVAGDLPGIDLRDSSYATEDGRGVLTVAPAVQRTEWFAGLDNHGSGSAGPIRLRTRLSINDAALSGDQLTFRATLTPLDPRELATVGGEYGAVLDGEGTLASLAGSYTRVRAGGRFGALGLDGRSVSVNLGLSRPLKRSADANLWGSLDLAVRDSEQDDRRARLRDDRVTTLGASLSGYDRLGEGWLSGRATVRQGLGTFGATRSGDPLASRLNGDGVFTKVEAYADWTGTVAPRVRVRLAAEGQAASRPLLSSEEFGIGGPRFGRAYDYSERRGDNGVAGSVELGYRLAGPVGPAKDVTPYVFLDGGYVDNLRSRRDGGLVSAGSGLRAAVGRFIDAELEVGVPLGPERFETGNRNPRLSFSISARF